MITGLGLHDTAPEAAPETGPELLIGLPPPAPRRLRWPAAEVSLLVHLLLVVATIRVVQTTESTPAEPPVVARRIRLNMPAQLMRKRPPARPVPRPPEPLRDRISIGPPSDQQARRLELRRDEDITKTPHGESLTPRPPLATPAPPAEATLARPVYAANAPLAPPMPPAPSSLRSSVARALQSAGDWGTATGTGVQMGPLRFDPQGADFTRWVQHFKDEVYRNWIVPPSVLWGWGGSVGFRFVVERDGSLSAIDDVSTSGKPALDRAARNALRGSRLLPLPNDYAPSQLTIDVVFDYGPAQAASR